MQRIQSEPNVLQQSPASDKRWQPADESTSFLETPHSWRRGPQSARSCSSKGREGAWGEERPGPRWSGDGVAMSSRQAAGRSTEGIGNLMPIVQRTAITPAASSSLTRLAGPQASDQALTPPERPFQRRLGGLRSPHSSKKRRPRVSQLVHEPVQEDSPKGLDRALTPSMLKAVKQGDKSDRAEALTARKSSGGLSVFQSSFSKQCNGGEAGDNYDSLVVPFRTSLDEPPSTSRVTSAQSPSDQKSFRQTATASPSSAAVVGSGATVQAPPIEGLVARSDHADVSHLVTGGEVSTSAQEAEGLGELNTRDSEGNSAIIMDDHVQLLARRKALNISTTRQKDVDQPRKINLISDSSSSYPLLPAKPSKFIRSNITRVSRRSVLGFSKPLLFELYNMKGRLKLYAERESGHSLTFNLFSPADGPEKKRLEASLVASTFVENQFLLIGTGPSSPIAACDPDQDPVVMAVSFSKNQNGQRSVTVLLPDNKLSTAGDNDLGDKSHINDFFVRFERGEPLQNVTVLQSVPGKELIGARITRGSVKNVQLQIIASGQDWPGTTPKYATPAHEQRGGFGKTVFEFGRLRHDHQFVCDYESPLLTPTQALGLAVACSTPKRAFLYI